MKVTAAPEKRAETLLAIVTGFVFLHWWWGKDWMLYVALAVGLLGLLVAPVGKAIHWLWMQFTRILGWVNSRLILSVIFYLVLLPIGWLFRFFQKDPLSLKSRRETYFTDRNHTYTAEDLSKPW
ncbi:MAG: hypothetical protein KDC43_15845 [Saprospiraceae bacterium]|nr:hypothetical protein [Saprospiraceae bacterium]MCB0625345.1 hypothetical protein [Saprospiraceae bacterium]MCB0678936.1 hypothetical protein [Saprospiraceae bacterium]MCB0680098.1 hypothetical protein [Saprospiraceae bacterium]